MVMPNEKDWGMGGRNNENPVSARAPGLQTEKYSTKEVTQTPINARKAGVSSGEATVHRSLRKNIRGP